MGDAAVMDKKLERVDIYTGLVAHLVDFAQPPVPGVDRVRLPSLCNYRPVWPSIWFGLNGDADRAAAMPLCGRCESVQEAIARDSA